MRAPKSVRDAWARWFAKNPAERAIERHFMKRFGGGWLMLAAIVIAPFVAAYATSPALGEAFIAMGLVGLGVFVLGEILQRIPFTRRLLAAWSKRPSNRG